MIPNTLEPMTRRIYSATAAAAVAIALLFSPLQADAQVSGDPHASNTIQIRMNTQITTLDWNRASSAQEMFLISHLMRGLFRVNESLQIVPELCESHSVSADGLTYHLKIRKGVLWSDQKPLVAQHFIDSWHRLLSPLLASDSRKALFDIIGAYEYATGANSDSKSVAARAVSETEIEIKLKRRSPNFLAQLTLPPTFPIRLDAVQKHGNEWEKPGRMVALGPFFLESVLTSGEEITLTRPLSSTERQKHMVSRIVAKIVREDARATALFEAGQLDYVPYLGKTATTQYTRDPRMIFVNPLRVEYLRLESSLFPTLYDSIRKAIAHGFDRAQIVDLFGASRVLATSFVPEGILGHAPSIGLKFDAAHARTLLKKSGIASSQLKIEMLYNKTEKYELIAQSIRSQLKNNLGIEITLVPKDYKEYRILRDLKTYAAVLGGWNADLPHGENFLGIFSDRPTPGQIELKNPEFFQALDRSYTTSLRSEAERELMRAQKILQNDLTLVIPLFYDRSATLVSRRLGPFRPKNRFGIHFETIMLKGY